MKTKRFKIAAGIAAAALTLTSCSLTTNEGEPSKIPAHEILAETIHNLSQKDTLAQGASLTFELKINATHTLEKSLPNKLKGAFKGKLIVEPDSMKFALTTEAEGLDDLFNSLGQTNTSIELYGEPSGNEYTIYQKYGKEKWKKESRPLQEVQKELDHILKNPQNTADKKWIAEELRKQLSEAEKFFTIKVTEDSDLYSIQASPTSNAIKELEKAISERGRIKISEEDIVFNTFLKVNKDNYLPSQLGLTLRGKGNDDAISADLDLIVDIAIPADTKVSIPEEARKAE